MKWVDRKGSAPMALIVLTALSGCGADGPSTTDRIVGVHMAELNGDFTKVYLTSSDKNEVVVVDARTLGRDTSSEGLMNRAYIVSRDSAELAVIDLRSVELFRSKDYEILSRIRVGAHPTHLATSRDGRLIGVMAEEEGDGAVSFIETASDTEVQRLAGFYTPHFIRFSPDGRYAYIANLDAHHLTRVDLPSFEIDENIPLDGYEGADVTRAPGEGGFGDAQIDASGMLYAAHAATGRVLVYDTVTRQKRGEVTVGSRPWIAFAEHPFENVPLRHLVPNFGDRTVSVIDATEASVPSVVASLPGDEEAYGVNFSSQAPDKAFVMNRIRRDIAVVDTTSGEITARIPVGGNTETAATSADGKWIVATVSSANRVVVIDAVTNEIVRSFDDVGRYPWSVTIPMGQNYCH